MTDPKSDVRANVIRMESTLGDVPAMHDDYFKEESAADDWANRIIDEYLARLEADEPHAAARAGYLLCRGIFAAALYSWYADLRSFCKAIGLDRLSGAKELVFAMAQDRQNYVRAASLFGDVHRHTLMRAEISIEAVLKNRTDWFEHCEWSRRKLDARGPEEVGEGALQKWWLEETVLRYCLLSIVVDTAVKLAYVGAASSWWKKHGGSQMLLMNFESIDRAVARIGKHGN